METPKNLRNIAELGEFKLIEELTHNFQLRNKSIDTGIGDDCAVIDRNKKEYTLISTDTLTEGIHFDPMYMPMKHLGYKSVAVNVSDICAMNGTPEYITVSIAVSSKYSVEALQELYEGIHAACKSFNVDLVGGDTSAAVFGLTITVSVFGVVKKTAISKRSGAKEFDLLVVSGDLGGAFMGLQVLEREKEVFKSNPEIQPDLEGHDYIVEKQLKPEARVDVLTILKNLEVLPTSMIDISDGLASEILHICTNSKVGCHVYSEKIPIDHKTQMCAMDFNLDPVTTALNGGEDYELLFTIDQKDHSKIASNPNFSIIGHITTSEKGVYLIDKQGMAVELKAQGWRHFN